MDLPIQIKNKTRLKVLLIAIITTFTFIHTESQYYFDFLLFGLFETDFLRTLLNILPVVGVINSFILMLQLTDHLKNKKLKFILLCLTPIFTFVGVVLVVPNLLYLAITNFKNLKTEAHQTSINPELKQEDVNMVNSLISKYQLFKVTSFVFFVLIGIGLAHWLGRNVQFYRIIVTVLLLSSFWFINVYIKNRFYIFVNHTLEKSCNVLLMYALIIKLNRLEEGKSFRNILVFSEINTLLSLGLSDDAKNVLDLLKPVTIKWHELEYYNSLFKYYSCSGNVELMIEILEIVKKLRTKLRIKEHSNFDNMLLIMEARITMLQENYEKAKKLFLRLLENTDILLSKVSYHYHLACIDMFLENIKDAQIRFQYVIDNGSTLEIVKKAKDVITDQKTVDTI